MHTVGHNINYSSGQALLQLLFPSLKGMGERRLAVSSLMEISFLKRISERSKTYLATFRLVKSHVLHGRVSHLLTSCIIPDTGSKVTWPRSCCWTSWTSVAYCVEQSLISGLGEKMQHLEIRVHALKCNLMSWWKKYFSSEELSDLQDSKCKVSKRRNP